MSDSKYKKDWVEIEDELDLHNCLNRTVDCIINDNKKRLQNISRNLRAYEDANDPLTGFTNCRMLSLGNEEDTDEELSNGYNVLKVCVNTLANKIGKNKINPRVITNGAPYRTREKVKKADKFLKAVFRQLNVRDEAKKALFDACLHGTGLLKVCNDGNDISVERAMPDEVFVDVYDGYRGKPSRIYEVRFVARSTLREMFKDDKDKVLAIDTADSLPFSANETLNTFEKLQNENQQNIAVIEAWCVRGDGHKGRHIISISNKILFDEEWDKDYLPFVPIYYNKPLVGFYATGMGHELKDVQRNIREMDNLIDESIHAMVAPKILINGASNIKASQIDNVPGTILTIEGIAPGTALNTIMQPLTPMAISGEVYNYRAGKIRDAHDQCGVSQMAASGHKPTGLDSGVALREYNDIQTERFVLLGQEWEEAHKNLSKILFKEMQEIGDYIVRSERGSSLKPMRLRQLDLDLDDTDISVYPVSSLPQTPSARLQAVQELVEFGVVHPSQVAELLDLPDLEEHNTINQAPRRAVDRFISRIMDNPFKPFVINRFMDIEYLMEQSVLFFNYVLSEIDDDTFDEYFEEEPIVEIDDSYIDDDEMFVEDEGEEIEEVVEKPKKLKDYTDEEIARQLLQVFTEIANECEEQLKDLAASQQPVMPQGGQPMGGEEMMMMDPSMGGMDPSMGGMPPM